MASNSTISEFAHLQIPLEEIVKATDNFSDESIIGKGGFGNVYKGKIMNSGTLINISARRLDRRYGQGDVEFWTEISVLSSLKHKNLVRLIGYCDEKNEKIIVTEYYPKGSLSLHLTDTTNLDWLKRTEISCAIANAIQDLHENIGQSYHVIHRNINSSTILLDDDWIPKLSGFEFSIKHPVDRKNHVVLCEPIGTKGYMDPEIEKTGGFTHKSDIYSFGILLFELFCGRKAFDPKAGVFLGPLARFHYENDTLQDIVNPDLWVQMDPESIAPFAKAAYHCLQEERTQRSDAKLVIKRLKVAHCFASPNRPEDYDEDFSDITVISYKQEPPYPWKVKGFGHLRISLTDILLGANNFSPYNLLRNSREMQEYYGEVECFDRENMLSIEEMTKSNIPKRLYTVNFKKLFTRSQKFNTEIEILSSCKHHNIETFLGFCDEGPDMILVFEFFRSHSLHSQLEELLPTWEKRLKMCLEIAHGLNYIHNEMEDQQMVIHRAISSENILLGVNGGVKITGFRESLLVPPNRADDTLYFKNTNPHFNPYTDPEYAKTGKLKRESDVYSFGVVMLEIICGKSVNLLTSVKDGQDQRELLSEVEVRQWFDTGIIKKKITSVLEIICGKSTDGQERERVLLSQLVRQWFDTGIMKKKITSVLVGDNGDNKFYLNKGPNEDSLETLLKIAYRCLAETQNERPTMKVVVKELKKALSFHVNNKDTFRMSLEEIKLATNNFRGDHVIGGGGFGKVYKGEVAHRHGNGNYAIVAKRLDTSHGQGEEQYYNELQILYEYKHENVIGLVGYNDETCEKIIVYEHACKGSLDKYLNDASLTWRNRLMICIDFATGLDFLHGGIHGKEVVIHRDIKAANILLFDEWKAKIGDFGLSIISTVNEQTDYVIDHACGTRGYLDPLYQQSGFLTIESDIYSFGVVLFEILCGRSTFEIHKCEGRYLPSFMKHKFEEGKQGEVVFEALKKKIMPKSLTTFQNIAYQCLDEDREKRPRAKQVLAQLKKALAFHEDANIGAETS